MNTNLQKYILYADGSCHNNGTPKARAGWAAVFFKEGEESNVRKEDYLTGLVPGPQTNNRAELSAVIAGLANLIEKTQGTKICVTVKTDSEYITNAINNEWIHAWHRNGWLTKSNRPVQNVEMWQLLIAVCRTIALNGEKVKFEHVDGHAGDKFNEECDKRANEKAIAA